MRLFQLKVFLKSFKILSDEDLDLILSFAKFRTATEGTILNKGELAGKVFFINKGCVRAYYTNKYKEEITRMISWENRMLINVQTLESTENQDEIIECLEDTELIYISKKDFDNLTQISSGFRDFAFRLLETHLMRYVQKSYYIGLDTKTKMHYLKTYYRPLIGRVKDAVLSSFLSISREHFVRNKKFL